MGHKVASLGERKAAAKPNAFNLPPQNQRIASEL